MKTSIRFAGASLLLVNLVSTVALAASPKSYTHAVNLSQAEMNQDDELPGTTNFKYLFNTGGCGRPQDNIISYDLKARKISKRITDQNLRNSGAIGATVDIELDLTVQETRPSGAICAMGYAMGETVNLNELAKSKAKEIGVDFSEPNTDFNMSFRLMNGMSGYGSITNWPATEKGK